VPLQVKWGLEQGVQKIIRAPVPGSKKILHFKTPFPWGQSLACCDWSVVMWHKRFLLCHVSYPTSMGKEGKSIFNPLCFICNFMLQNCVEPLESLVELHFVSTMMSYHSSCGVAHLHIVFLMHKAVH
jgi:hypothetical protein